MNDVNRRTLLIVAWLWVAIPFIYGLLSLIQKVTQLFTG